jgi:hypothetical protein
MPVADTVLGINRAQNNTPFSAQSSAAVNKQGTATSVVSTAVIGRVPGFNKNTDKDGEFARQLLKGVTFVDLLPMSYRVSEVVAKMDIKTLFNQLSEIIKKPSIFEADSESMMKIFSGVLERMQNDFGLSKGFADASMIRIIGANDSTFTETFSNDFGQENSLVSMAKSASESLRNANPIIRSGATAIVSGIKGFSYSYLINLVGGAAKNLGNLTGQNLLSELLTGAFFGMNIAAPKQWGGSSYSSTLNMFIKLVAPVGSPECIKKNILEPLLYLLAAASPITYGGSMYGFPLLWDVQAHGITNFRLGAIAAMTITRGSFETTFNYLLQPTIVDVRLTIVPLLTDFAVQTSDSDQSIYTDEAAGYFGVQNPSDLKRGVTNERAGMEPEQILSIRL